MPDAPTSNEPPLISDEPPSKGTKFFPYLLDLVALGFVLGFADGIRTGQSWYVYIGCLVAGVLCLLVAFRWSWIGHQLASEKRNRPVLATAVLTLLLFAAVGYDIYDRHYWPWKIPNLDEAHPIATLDSKQMEVYRRLLSMSNDWDTYKYTTIYGRNFSHETVVLDGRRFVNCNFDSVTMVFEGTAPFLFDGQTNHGTGPETKIESSVAQIKGILSLYQTLGRPGWFELVPK